MNDISVNKYKIQDVLYYENEPLLSITINYPYFNLNKYRLFAKHLNNFYFSKLVIGSKDYICMLYRLAISQYEYASLNNFPFRVYEYYIDFEIAYSENCTLSLYYDTYTYTGGAHGSTIKKSNTWNLDLGKEMSLEDYIVDSVNYKEFVIDGVINMIEATKGTSQYVYFDEYEKLVKDTFDDDNFYLTQEGLNIYFQQYDIAPYSSGIPTFTFPYENTNVIEPYCVKD